MTGRLGALPLGIHCGPRYRTVNETDIVDVLLVYGWAYEQRQAGRATLAGEVGEALDRLVRDGLPCEFDSSGARLFDPAEVINFVKYSGLNSAARLWEDRFVATGRRLARDFAPGAGNIPEGPPRLETFGEERFAVALVRDFHLPHVRAGARVRLRLPLPVEDEALRDLTIGFNPPADFQAETTIAPGRVDVCFTMPSEISVSLAVDLSFQARPTLPGAMVAPLDTASANLYTRPREALLVVSPRVRALAAELTEGTVDRATMVQRIWNFMIDRLHYGVMHYDELPAAAPVDQVLNGGWYDCQLGSALLAALCRACGIPARQVGGYLLYPTAATNHHWSEVWFDDRGWVPFDLSCWDLSVGGRDSSWRDLFNGRLDYRMKTQVMPLCFTGTPGVRFPPAWRLIQRMEDQGIALGYSSVDSGIPIFRDRVSVRLVESSPATSSRG